VVDTLSQQKLSVESKAVICICFAVVAIALPQSQNRWHYLVQQFQCAKMAFKPPIEAAGQT